MDASKLPQWKSHKVVRAARIRAIMKDTVAGDEVRTLELEGGETWTAVLKHAIWARYVPVEGDYLVVYDDGYTSLSPAKAFEEGYAPLHTSAEAPFTIASIRRHEGVPAAIVLKLDRPPTPDEIDWLNECRDAIERSLAERVAHG